MHTEWLYNIVLVNGEFLFVKVVIQMENLLLQFNI